MVTGTWVCFPAIVNIGDDAKPPVTSFEHSFKNSQKHLPELKLMDTWHLVSVQAEATCSIPHSVQEFCMIWKNSRSTEEKTVHYVLRYMLKWLDLAGGVGAGGGEGGACCLLLAVCFLPVFVQENLAITTIADCRNPKEPYDAQRSVTVDYIKYR